jgi:hypothetical protein
MFSLPTNLSENKNEVDLTKNKSYSDFKFSQVSAAWKKACLSGDLETSSRWVVEMVLSGWLNEWWEQVVILCAKNIHFENPKISCFLLKVASENSKFLYGNENNSIESIHSELKQTIFLVLGVCCFSPKAIPIPSLQIRLSSYEISKGIESLQKNSKLHELVKPFFFYLPSYTLLLSLLSALTGHIINCNLNQSMRIISWILFLEKDKKYKHFFPCDYNDENVEKKDWVMILWKILISLTDNSKEKKKIVSAWKTLFDVSVKNSKTKNYKIKRNKYFIMLLSALFILTETNLKTIQCIQNYGIIEKTFLNSEAMFHHVRLEKKKKHIEQSQGFF